MGLCRREATRVDRLDHDGLVSCGAVAVTCGLHRRPGRVPCAVSGPIPPDLNRAGGIVIVTDLSGEGEHRAVVARGRGPREIHGGWRVRRRRRGWRTRELPCGKGVELPVVRALPEDESLDVEGDASVGLFLGQRRIVARRDVWSAVSFPEPIAVDLDFHVPARSPDRDYLPFVCADRFVALMT